ncbi:MAG: hypothetical protein QMD92_05760 [bacterium]|nr:hypothetical protein [bacterium]
MTNDTFLRTFFLTIAKHIIVFDDISLKENGDYGVPIASCEIFILGEESNTINKVWVCYN